MSRSYRSISALLFGLNIFMIVLLVFIDRMQFPAWIQTIGRIHPLLLHLPIGITVVAAVFLLIRKRFDESVFRKTMAVLLATGALTASLTAVMGLILSHEGGYDADTLNAHKWAGVLFAAALTIAYESFTQENDSIWLPPAQVKIIFNATCAAAVALLLITGHFGSVLTHGNQFILAPLLSKSENKKVVSDSTSLFIAAIQPVFDKKCAGCHNDKKKKGGLSLETLDGIAKGGEDGVVWKPGSPQSSLLMKRILLPEGHEDHMPPDGKIQLTAAEVQLLFQWILSGADTSKAWTKYHPSDSVRRLAEQFINRSSAPSQHYTFDPASPKVVEKLNDPYRTVDPVAQNEPALSATFFIRNEFKPSRLEELLAVKGQLVSLNLSKMPITDAECETIRKFERLEKLNLNFSSITAAGLKKLSSLPELRSLSVAGTTLDNTAIDALKDFKKLKEVYTWNTAIAMSDIQLPGVTFYSGFVPDANEKLRLTPPIPVSDKTLLDIGETVALTHKLPGTVIRYTTDGSDPDSVNAKVYQGPIAIKGYTTVKTRACKDGWFCSPVGTYVLYNKGVTPLETKLFTQPNKDYRGEGAATLTNNKKGFTDDHRDIAWVGFRENPLSAEFRFTPGTTIHDITFSYDHNPEAWLFPPVKMEIWGGKDAAHLQLLKQLKPDQPVKMEPRRNAALVIPVDGSYEVYKIMAWPVPELPKWHPSNNPKTKDKRAWLFVDEVIFGQ